MNETQEQRERRLEYQRKYYQAHKEKISKQRTASRLERLEAMTDQERQELRQKNAEYQREYRRANPSKVAQWALNGAQRVLDKLEGIEHGR